MFTDKIIIGLDLDGVIIDHTGNKIALAQKFGLELLPRETVSDVISEKMTSTDYEHFQTILYDDPNVAYAAHVMPGVLQGLARIKEKHPYFLISRRKSNVTALAFMKMNGLWPHYFNERNVFFVEKKNDKDKKAVELGVNIYMDDQPTVLAELRSVRNRYLFDHLNAYGDAGYPFERVSSWSEFISRLF